MKRIEIEIDDDIDALFEEMTSADEASRPAILRSFVEAGVLRMAGVTVVTDLGGSNGDGPKASAKEQHPDPLDALLGKYDEDSVRGRRRAPPSPLDAIVGSVDDDPVDDIDEIIYGR